MKFVSVVLAGASLASAASVTPTQKVVQLLEGMAAKGKEEKHAEEVAFAEYKQFCEGTKAEKEKAIADATDKIEALTADIEKYAADAADLATEIGAHEEDIAVWTGDNKAATKVREIEKADHLLRNSPRSSGEGERLAACKYSGLL